MDRCGSCVTTFDHWQSADWVVSRQVHRRVSIRSGGILRHYPHLDLLLSTDSPFRRGSHARLRLQVRFARRRKSCASIAGVALTPQGGVSTAGKRQTCRPPLAGSALLNRAIHRTSGEEKADEQAKQKSGSSRKGSTARRYHRERGLGQQLPVSDSQSSEHRNRKKAAGNACDRAARQDSENDQQRM